MRKKASNSSCFTGRVCALFTRTWPALALIAAVAFLLYCRSLRYEFVWDDHIQVVANPLIRSWSTLRHVFTSQLWFLQSTEIRYYRPLFIVWEIFCFKLFGLAPWEWHLMTVLLHVAASCSVYLLARKLGSTPAASLFAGLLFAVHPVHIECACWVSAGSDSMVTLLCVTSFLALLRSLESAGSRRLLWLLASLLLLLLGLWTKEMALTFFAVVFVYLWTRSGEPWMPRLRQAALVTLPFVLVTVGYLLGRRFALQHVVQFSSTVGLGVVFATLPTVLLHYLGLLLFPWGLNGLYHLPYVTQPSLLNCFLPLLILLGLGAAFVYWNRRAPGRNIAFLALWMLLTLLPVLYLPLFRAGDFYRDRYLYLPSAGFVLLVAELLRTLPWRRVAFTLAALLLALAAAGAWSQQTQWSNDVTVFERGYHCNPRNLEGLNYAIALMHIQEFQRAQNLLQNEMMALYGNSGYLSLNLAICDGRLHQPERGKPELLIAIDTLPWEDSLTTQEDIAVAYEAIDDFANAQLWLDGVLQKSPDLPSAVEEKAYIYYRMGKLPEAESWFRKALALDPYDSETRFRYGLLLRDTGSAAAAEQEFRQAIQFGPVGRGYHFELAKLLLSQGTSREAISELRREVALFPDNREAVQLLRRSNP